MIHILFEIEKITIFRRDNPGHAYHTDRSIGLASFLLPPGVAVQGQICEVNEDARIKRKPLSEEVHRRVLIFHHFILLLGL